MNRIEEAIQRAKVARAVRERDSVRERESTREREVAREREREAAGERESVPRVDGLRPVAVDVAAAESPRNAPAPLEVDPARLVTAGLWPDATHERRLANEFRVAKRAVLGRFARAQPTARRVLAVTSALAGEGKSFASLHLALSLALERELAVLLVDGDAARPTLSRALGCEHRAGLLECLERNLPPDGMLLPTTVDRLWFLPAGRAALAPAELMSSPHMPQVLDRAAARLRNLIVVFDTSPLLLTVESRAVVDVASQVLLVVKANTTPEGAILQAVDQIGDADRVQLLLNQRQESRLDAYQYYYAYPANADTNVAAGG